MTLYLALVLSSALFGILWSRLNVWPLLSKLLSIPNRVVAIVRNSRIPEYHKERASKTATLMMAGGLGRVWVKLIFIFVIAFIPLGVAVLSKLISSQGLLDSVYDPVALLLSIVAAVMAARLFR